MGVAWVQRIIEDVRKWHLDNGEDDAKETGMESLWASGLVWIKPEKKSCNSFRWDMKVFYNSDGSRVVWDTDVIIGVEYVCEARC